ncbi:MAG TPA: VOC family protein [Candidatus Angelobacter sp.]|nr:VOC family protein [Candidatus Angelobacter sp.]
MTVKMKAVIPMLTVANLEDTITFYHDLLGFECVGYVDDWAAMRNGETEVMISLPNAHVPFEKPVFTGSLYFRPGNVDALWELLHGKTTVVYPLENFFYGMREFAILDNNGLHA